LTSQRNRGRAVPFILAVAALEACNHEQDLARIGRNLSTEDQSQAGNDDGPPTQGEAPDAAAVPGEHVTLVEPSSPSVVGSRAMDASAPLISRDCEGTAGDSPETALSIGMVQKLVTCSGLVEVGKPDFYAFDLEENAVFTYSAAGRPATVYFNVFLFVYAPQVVLDDQIDRLAGTQPDSHRVALERGSYLLRVEQPQQLYDLTMSAAPYTARELDPEPGEGAEGAAVLEASSEDPTPVSGFVGSSDESDHYRLHISADGALRIVFTDIVGASGVKGEIFSDAPILGAPLRTFSATGEGNPPTSPEYLIQAGDYEFVVSTASRPGALYTMRAFLVPGE
jgi:hypothetical protein